MNLNRPYFLVLHKNRKVAVTIVCSFYLFYYKIYKDKEIEIKSALYLFFFFSFHEAFFIFLFERTFFFNCFNLQMILITNLYIIAIYHI